MKLLRFWNDARVAITQQEVAIKTADILNSIAPSLMVNRMLRARRSRWCCPPANTDFFSEYSMPRKTANPGRLLSKQGSIKPPFGQPVRQIGPDERSHNGRFTSSNHLVETNREGHQSGDPRCLTRGSCPSSSLSRVFITAQQRAGSC